MSSISRYAISFGFHDATLLDLLCLVLRCWTFPTSRQGAWCPLDHVRVSNPFSRCYIVWSQSPNATPLCNPPYLLLLGVFHSHAFVFWSFDLVFTMLRCLIFSISCFTAWPEQLHVIRFRIEHILHAAWSWLHDAGLLDLVCLMLCCLIFPASRHAVWSSPNMFDLTFMVPRCLMVSTSCYGTEPSQQDVMLLDGPYFMLW